MDPQIEWNYASWGIFRCCLARTLLSHSGHVTNQGGAELRPDLATKLPDVSADGLTWTFTLKKGIHYGPPVQDEVVTSQDFIRAFSRLAKVGKDAYAPIYFNVIRGFGEYAAGKSDSIAGLEAPDATTLVIRLKEPAGDFGNRLVMPGTAPIPPLPGNASAAFGVATGHDDGYGEFLVSTGPYMIEGSDTLDFTKPPKLQPRLSGLSAGHFINLVRNPAWSAATDDLRVGYVDRIELRFPKGDRTSVSKMATTGRSDLDLSAGPGDQGLLDLAEKVRADPSLGSVQTAGADFVRYLSMNLAVPPFDDLHVRRSINYLIDKRKLLQLRGGGLAGSIAGHTAFDSLENNLLISYNPFRTPNDAGDLSLAKREMSQSKYDRDHDGVCDVAACRSVRGLAEDDSPFLEVGREIAKELSAIGIHVRLEALPPGDVYGQSSDPTTRTPLQMTAGWGKDFLNASNFFVPLLLRAALHGPNYSLLGATPAELRKWGYSVRSVPSLDERVDACLRITGSTQLQCWASLDQYVTEQVVPWVPLQFETNITITSPRVVAYSYDQWTIQPALDRIALKPAS
jgi:peptide/nickel transport system substrate-binding protein